MAGRAIEGKVVSQYNMEYCGRRQGCLCRKTGSCVATRHWAEALGARLGSRRQASGSWAQAQAGSSSAWVAQGARGRARQGEASAR